MKKKSTLGKLIYLSPVFLAAFVLLVMLLPLPFSRSKATQAPEPLIKAGWPRDVFYGKVTRVETHEQSSVIVVEITCKSADWGHKKISVTASTADNIQIGEVIYGEGVYRATGTTYLPDNWIINKEHAERLIAEGNHRLYCVAF